MSVYSGHIYISSQTCVWKLTPRSLNFQIKQLLESKEFELALKLAVSMNNKYVLHMHVHVIKLKTLKLYRSLKNAGIWVKKTTLPIKKGYQNWYEILLKFVLFCFECCNQVLHSMKFYILFHNYHFLPKCIN